ncbi:MAG: CAP domain-containing protein [Bdellovibrionota bacterium]
MVFFVAGVLTACAPGSSGSPGVESSSSTPPNTTPVSNTGDLNCIDTTADVMSVRIVREEICAIANVERAKVGAKPLKLEATRSEVAQAHAEDMVSRNYFSHTSPDGDGPDDRLRAAGVTWSTWGENIAKNSSGSAASVMTQWMNSSGHKANILNGSFGRLGVGKQGSDWVQVFTN